MVTHQQVDQGRWLVSKLLGLMDAHGYAGLATMICFFGALNCVGLSILGEYLWRVFENSTRRPLDILAGSAKMREAIEGGVHAAEIAATWRDDEVAFRALCAPYLRYA